MDMVQIGLKVGPVHPGLVPSFDGYLTLVYQGEVAQSWQQREGISLPRQNELHS